MSPFPPRLPDDGPRRTDLRVRLNGILTAGRARGRWDSYPNLEKGKIKMDNEMRDQAEMAENIGIAVSRRKAFAMAAKLGLGGAALAGGLGTGLAANPPGAGGGPAQKSYKIVFVNHVTTNEFFTPTIYGIQDACAFFGCSYQWTGSQNSVVSEMVNAMQTAIAGKADGIA